MPNMVKWLSEKYQLVTQMLGTHKAIELNQTPWLLTPLD